MNTLLIESVSNNGHSSTQPLFASTPLQSKLAAPDPQVIQKPIRRRFTTAEKLRILKAADACQKPGELGALLRREGIYSSYLTNFRKQRAEGRLSAEIGTADKVTQRRAKEAARQQENRKIARMQNEIQQLRGLLELQKKLSDLLGIHLQNLPDSDASE